VEYINYAVANNIAEAIALGKNDRAYFLAGGTDLLVKIKAGKLKPSVLIDLKKIPGLSGITTSGQSIEIGALTTVRDIETSPLIIEQLNMLSTAAGKLGSVQVRNRATIGGNLCNAAPSAETAPSLLCLEAETEIIGNRGVRRVPLENFFSGPGQTVLREGEFLHKIVLPIPTITTRGVYYKLSVRKAMDIAFVGVAVLVDITDEKINKVRIGLGAVSPTPMLVKEAENILVGQKLSLDLAKEVADVAAKACQPISDIRASAAYRREMVRNLTLQGLFEIYNCYKMV
jgi:carbon-monoxide dehydrogenase medium subunit